MQREQNTIGFLSQIGKTLELFINLTTFDYPEQKSYYQIKNLKEVNKRNIDMQRYLNNYTKNILDKKIAYYASNDYKVRKLLYSNSNNK